jgi:hypothetical protein
MKLLGVVFKLLVALVVVATPLLGVWLASSLAAYLRGPLWAAVAGGLVLFPGLPLVWEAWAARRRQRRAARAAESGARPPRPRRTTLGDRLVLRTLAVNLLFLGALLAWYPQQAFAALSTRGDWMLEGRRGAGAQTAREVLHHAADRLEWLYRATHDNPYRRYADTGAQPTPAPRPAPAPAPAPASQPTPPPPAPAPLPPPQQPAPAPSPPPPQPAPAPPPPPSQQPAPAPPPPPSPRPAPTWPAPPTLHPVVAGMPPEAESDVASVGRYIRDREPDAVQRLKALHDWVADRVRYDADAYFTRRLPPQDATTVFRTRTAVCAGYAKLLQALGRAADVEIVYVTGDARARSSGLSGEGHAWNAARVGDGWYLIDATWDAGSLDGRAFVKQYRTDYFMTPPEVFGIDHFPDRPEWQLREKPLARGDFLRQPALKPGFFAHGLELLEPTRSQTDVRQAAVVRVRNPRGLFFLAKFEPLGGGAGGRCDVQNGPEARVRCAFPAAGAYRVLLFGNRARYGTFDMLGQLDMNNTP